MDAKLLLVPSPPSDSSRPKADFLTPQTTCSDFRILFPSQGNVGGSWDIRLERRRPPHWLRLSQYPVDLKTVTAGNRLNLAQTRTDIDIRARRCWMKLVYWVRVYRSEPLDLISIVCCEYPTLCCSD